MSRTAIVTGASRGIGAAVAAALAKRGLRVASTYRSHPDGVAELTAEYGDAILPVPYDLGDNTSAEDVVATVLDRWGRLDTLVVNAATWRGGRLGEIAQTDWQHAVESNVAGMAQLCAAALPALRDGENPSILLMSSVVGIIGFPGDTAYATVKASMIGFARSLAKELGRDGVRVNVLAPGFVETEMTSGVSEQGRAKITQGLVLRRFGTPEEIAAAAVFLTEDATYCTGTVLTTDGGLSL
jgi:3-oxoacyl-[acyl-carrier protein] reductase